MTTTRSCGTCTLCCKTMAVSALNKPRDTWCSHCRPGKGCGIYDTRPPECRSFGCLWLADPNFPDELKPERSKLVFVVEANGNRLVAHCDPGRPTAWKEPRTYRLIKDMAVRAAQSGRQVLVMLRGDYTAILPDRDVPLGAVEPGRSIIYREMGAGLLRRIEPVVE
ncbi:hypothetical protein SAMN05519103_05535 [Rhizobiales bacterium GAS113]|jgi:hypothetical protein|nr:hypothetical protein SAMN05519103_05535 [Rhizobiales bacterium GAS113]